MAEQQDFSQLVVVGSSAGGIEVLSTLLSSLDADFPAPIVIAQHLDPERVSHLQEILSRRTKMPVVTVSRTERLKPGTAFVVPSNRDVYITNHEVGVRIGNHAHAQPSVDLLLTTAADVYGDRLIAVILTGTGSDGAAGARAVKRSGGTVVIQDPSTAPFPGMPLALATNLVDVVASADRMGTVLRNLLDGTPLTMEPERHEQLSAFLEDVRARSGIDFHSYKTPTILRRLHRRVVATDSGDLDTYMRYASAHPEEYQQLVNSFLIKVTEFFRDPELYTYLRDVVLPDVINYSRARATELRIWSAGCATGEEAYSLAILLSEMLGNDDDHMNARIFGTDADAGAIAFARRGIYPASALAGVPEDLLARYFSQDGNTYQVRKRVRSLTIFGQHDLGSRAPFPHIDMVVCRNVLIYFTPELQQRTLHLFAYSLRNDGYLVLGKAESVSPLAELFQPSNPLLKVFRREGDRVLMPPSRFVNATEQLQQQQPALGLSQTPGRLNPLSPRLDVQRARNLNEAFLMHLPVGVVVVDRHYDIQFINAAARRLLAIHGVALAEDLVHLAQRIPTNRLRETIDDTFRKHERMSVGTVAVQDVAATGETQLQIECDPVRLEGEDGPFEAVMVVIYDVTTFITAQHETQRQLSEASSSLQHARQASDADAAKQQEIVERLTRANQDLVEANQELTTLNEDLRANNEELMLSAEEAQAATEEVETLNEELQATNEELETLNEELQATNEELNTTNDDMAARGTEMLALARTNDEERARLKSILSSMSDAVLLMDASGAPILTNKAYDQTFGEIKTTWLPRDEDGNPLPADSAPLRRAARGETFSMEFTFQTPTGAPRWYEANGQPVTTDAGPQGAVVVIRDITDRSLHQLQEEFMARASHELRTPLTPMQAMLQQLDRRLKQQGADETTCHFAETAYEQVKRLTRLVSDLLDVSALQNGRYTVRPARIRFDEVVAQAIEMSQFVAVDWTIDYEPPSDPIWINGDADRLQQVLLNLFNNAFSHAASTPRLTVRLRSSGRDAELQVQDYGPGIPEADLHSIFSRFYQSGGVTGKEGSGSGLGLGLYIAHEIVGAHGGTVTATSTVGKGTTFIVRLPLTLEEEGSKKRDRK
jgi:two-component system, chemotaxis family, CheB/CheR fusion protein